MKSKSANPVPIAGDYPLLIQSNQIKLYKSDPIRLHAVPIKPITANPFHLNPIKSKSANPIPRAGDYPVLIIPDPNRFFIKSNPIHYY